MPKPAFPTKVFTGNVYMGIAKGVGKLSVDSQGFGVPIDWQWWKKGMLHGAIHLLESNRVIFHASTDFNKIV